MSTLRVILIAILALATPLLVSAQTRSRTRSGTATGVVTVVNDQRFSCEGRTVVASCPSDSRIKVMDVYFGRNDTTTCVPDNPNMERYQRFCQSNNALRIVSRECDGQSSCSFEATRSKLGRLGCDRDAAFFQMTFMCEQTLYTSLMCEASGRMPLTCRSGSVIEVRSAFFGRRDLATCPHRSANVDQTCNGTSTLEIFRQLCHGRQSCEIMATTRIFGEPCVGNYKYLQLEYLCSECANSHTDDAECNLWRSEGECNKNTEWMMANCRKACTNCDQEEPRCENIDSDDDCERWRSQGNCQDDAAYMLAYCRRTCIACDSRTACRSSYQAAPNTTSCSEWAAEGECFNNPIFMLSNCAGHCFCDRVGPSNFVQCRNRRADDGQCTTWESEGFCDTNPGFMLPQCFQSCTGCTEAPQCRNLHSSDEDCERWATEGECRNNAQWMHVNCWRSCTLCDAQSECVNTHTNSPECDYWAQRGQCHVNPEFMILNCYRSCTRCQPANPINECVNTGADDAQCDEWAGQGLCNGNAEWMFPYCRKSCTLCDRAVAKMRRIGNPALPGNVLRVTAGRSFILPGSFESDGRLVNFYTFFASRDPVQMGIWRMENGQYRQVFSMMVTPMATRQAETVLVEECFVVRRGDKLGFTSISGRASPVSFTFKGSSIEPLNFRYAGSSDTFRTMRLPYVFSLGATYDENTVNCSS